MSTYTETNFDDANIHIVDTLNYSLKEQLSSNRWTSLKAWSIITPLIALYRYSELLSENIQIYDLVAEGHKSHTSGTDLDFGYAGSDHRKKAIHQVRIIKDMLELKDAIRAQSEKISVFRLGFYFDRFDNDDNLKAMQKATDKDEKFEELYKHRTGVSSMHLGLRYEYNNKIYHGSTMSKSAGKFGFWGQGSEGFHRGTKWATVFKAMDGNLKNGQVQRLATVILGDFQMLDFYPPGVIYGRDPESETVWV